MLAELTFLLSTAQEVGQTRRAREQGLIQAGYMKDALKDLGLAEKSLQESLGSSLALPTLESQRALDVVSESGQETMEQIGKKQEQISQATGFANIGMDDDIIKDVRKEFKRKREDVDIALSKSLSDVLSQYEQQKFEMKSQRQQLEMQKKMAEQQANTKYFGIL
jgi:diacylglycerol kinase family enzyme